MKDLFKLSRKGMIVLAACIAVPAYALLEPMVSDKPAFRFSFSESLPSFLYKVDYKDRDFGRGDLIVFTMPPNEAYGRADATKYIMGIAGDEIVVDGREISIRGQSVGRAKEVSRTGAPLQVVESQIIPEGYIYVYAPHIDSFDSRYSAFGLVSIYDIQGKAKPIF